MAPANHHGPTAADEVSEGTRDANRDDIARRAYELFLARGGTHGYDLEDWIAAEHELTSIAAPIELHPIPRTDRPAPPIERTRNRRSHPARV